MKSRGAAVAIERHSNVVIAVLFSILLLYPPLYSLYCFGIETIFGYFADDAFYYLTVAKNSTFGFFTFDGEKQTNGFHPLWQYILTALFGALGRHDLQAQMYATHMLGAVFVTLGFILMGWSLHRITRSVYWPVWLIPGPFYMLFTIKGASQEVAHGMTYTFSPWAFMNGMESPCSVFAGGMFIYLLTRMCYPVDAMPSQPEEAPAVKWPADKMLIVLGLSLALLIMARLDDVFLLFSCALFFLFVGFRGQRCMRRVAILVLPTVAVLAAYMAFNYFSGQSLIPVSGKVKSTAVAALSGNIETSLSDFFPPIHSLIRPQYSPSEWSVTAVRSSPLILPIVFALWLTVYVLKSKTKHPEMFHKFKWVLIVLGYIVLKGMYNLVNVRLGSQGYWYHTLPIVMLNYLVILLCWVFISRDASRRCSLVRTGSVGLFVLVYLFVSANMIFSSSFAGDKWRLIWRDRHEITSELKKIDPNIKLIDRSDGVFAYLLDIPAVCAQGYAIDYDGFLALQSGKLLDYCVARGFDVTFEGRHAYPISKEGYTFTKIYEHKASDTAFFRIRSVGGQSGNGERGASE
jgi:hypothetical protein